MFDFEKEKKRFITKCTACGLCVEPCPMVPFTALKNMDSQRIIEEVLILFQHGISSQAVRDRVYSCLYCNTCKPHCPEGLIPALGFLLARKILSDINDPVPEGVSTVLNNTEEGLSKVLQFLESENKGLSWLTTDTDGKKIEPCKTVFFPSCYGLIEVDVITTAMELIHRIDSTAQALGGFSHCCGEIHLISGKPQNAEAQFGKLVKGLNAFSPEKVITFCPTCYMNFDLHNPDADWSWQFITDYLADNLDKLGPLGEISSTVTVHDPCHYVRGAKPGTDSPRRILQAIPGIRIVEMKNNRDKALCCGAYGISGTGTPGLEFRENRMMQARDTGADTLGVYCPGCKLIFTPEEPDPNLDVTSIITLLAKSLKAA